MSGADPGLLGVVLAGGGSRRFGSPKALATFRGEPLWRRAARTIDEAGLPVLVLANHAEVRDAVASTKAGAGPGPGGGETGPDVHSDLDPDVRPDRRTGRGPLAGIETGLIEARDRGLAGALALACDLVLVRTPMLDALVRAWPGSGVVAFEAPGPWGLGPVCALWGTDLLPEVGRALDDGRGSPGELLRSVPHVVVSLDAAVPGADPERVFRSVNRPADLAELEAETRTP